MRLVKSRLLVIIAVIIVVVPLIWWKGRVGTHRPNIVLVIIDTLRADKLGVYGNSSGASASLDKVLQRGVVFDQVYSQASWTRASVASLLTSKYPKNIPLTQEKWDVLPFEQHSLPEALKRAGYYTIGLTANPQLNKDFHFEQGFDEYYESIVTFSWMKPSPGKVKAQGNTRVKMAPEMLAKSAELLQSNTTRGPLYLQVLLMDVHAHHRIETDAIDADLVSAPDAPYLQAVRNVSQELSKFIDEATSILGDNTILIVTSDHGEGLHDHPSVESSQRHGNLLYDSHTRVPLVFIGPSAHLGEPGRVRGVVSLVDVYPTLLDILHLPPDTSLEGGSRYNQLMNSSRRHVDRTIAYSETSWRKGVRKVSVTDGEWLLVRSFDDWPGTAPFELQRVDGPQDGVRTDSTETNQAERTRLQALLANHVGDL